MKKVIVKMNYRMNFVYSKLKELEDAVKMDTYNLSRDKQDRIFLEIGKLKQAIDEQYSGSNC